MLRHPRQRLGGHVEALAARALVYPHRDLLAVVVVLALDALHVEYGRDAVLEPALAAGMKSSLVGVHVVSFQKRATTEE
jgi:hypothetical protein